MEGNKPSIMFETCLYTFFLPSSWYGGNICIRVWHLNSASIIFLRPSMYRNGWFRSFEGWVLFEEVGRVGVGCCIKNKNRLLIEDRNGVYINK